MAVRGYRDAKGRARYLVEFQQRGVRKLERLPPDTTHAQAKERETQLRRELYDGATLGHRPALLLSEVIQQWLDTKPHRNHRTLVNNANALARFVTAKTLDQAPTAAMEAEKAWTSGSASNGTPKSRKNSAAASAQTSIKRSWRECPLSRATINRRPAATEAEKGRSASATRASGNGPLARSTINRRLAILKAACHWAFDQGMIGQNLSARIKLRRELEVAREVYLTKPQVAKLAKRATPGTASAIWALAYTGLRVGELLAIPTNSCSRTDTLRVTSIKGRKRKTRDVPVALPARPHLRRFLALSPRPSYDQLSKEFLAARRAAGMDHVHIHDLRHTTASWLANEGVDLYTVAQILGDTMQMATRYTHLYDSTLREAVARLK